MVKLLPCRSRQSSLLFCLGAIACGAIFLADQRTLVRAWSPLCGKPLLVKKIQKVSRRAFIAGLTTGVVAGTAATAGAAVAINEQVNNRPEPYKPPPGSLVDQVVVITGGTTGLGLESAKRLSSAGATIVLTSRNEAKGIKAVESVLDYLSKAGVDDKKIYSLVLDLDDLESVKAFPASYKALKLGDISVLLNNAGVMAIPDRQVTKDGYERTFQSNHLGHFVLTSGLYPFLSRTKATVINVSSEAYNFARGGLDLANINSENEYGAWTSYGQSKLMNILFTQELQRRADASGDSFLTAVTLHPGAVSTDLGRNLVGEEKWNELKTNGPSGLESFALNALSVFTKTVPEGASTQIYLAAGADGKMEKSAFYEDMKVKRSLPAYAKDDTKAKQLWEKSEELGGVVFDIAPKTPTSRDSDISSTPAASAETTS
mmetsp:Transcript_18361/g.44336  ORF Transcript_18361/g.44336 Transcript_18361/m.44336 type:complete len:431 (-) Transcript_18361:40-1332(-)|eukprot:CAMPEP_0113460306 /NCGR_PEP_ID=MMETSP0014_2-20120614/10915_1 /TAXON_ID=2857 /ORGANISM="Nitzschia sp." /LENGTH=430 /DNA_ID=CAMNT_0000351947 /DNA_START=68 /DNA_END=1360 /DNA_ORIENTATION=- /assembly_acc=CAM_ASM_000159